MNKGRLAGAGIFAAVAIGAGAMYMTGPSEEVTPSTPVPAVATATVSGPTVAPPASPVSTPDAAQPSPTPRPTATPEPLIEPQASPMPSTPTSEGGPPAFPIEAVLADFTFTCTDENDLVIAVGPTWASYGASAPDIWMVGQWGTEQRAGEPQTGVVAIGEDQPAAGEYTVYNYISSKPPFYYDLTLEAYDQQVEGEPVILDEGTENEREASRGELFYPGEHGIEPVASETVHLLCDDGLEWVGNDANSK